MKAESESRCHFSLRECGRKYQDRQGNEDGQSTRAKEVGDDCHGRGAAAHRRRDRALCPGIDHQASSRCVALQAFADAVGDAAQAGQGAKYRSDDS